VHEAAERHSAQDGAACGYVETPCCARRSGYAATCRAGAEPSAVDETGDIAAIADTGYQAVVIATHPQIGAVTGVAVSLANETRRRLLEAQEAHGAGLDRNDFRQ
jgi:hypothetical protein